MGTWSKRSKTVKTLTRLETRQSNPSHAYDKTKSSALPFQTYDEEFAKVASYEGLLKSLSQRGFKRSWRPYKPKSNTDEIFMSTCSKILTQRVDASNLAEIEVNGLEKVKILSSLAEEFGGHRVPNSMLHTMTNLERIFQFYNVEVTKQSPYDLLDEGINNETLPQNLHVQLEPVRFDPANATNKLGRETAFPNQSTILVNVEARKKWQNYKAEGSPYKNSHDFD